MSGVVSASSLLGGGSGSDLIAGWPITGESRQVSTNQITAVRDHGPGAGGEQLYSLVTTAWLQASPKTCGTPQATALPRPRRPHGGRSSTSPTSRWRRRTCEIAHSCTVRITGNKACLTCRDSRTLSRYQKGSAVSPSLRRREYRTEGG